MDPSSEGDQYAHNLSMRKRAMEKFRNIDLIDVEMAKGN